MNLGGSGRSMGSSGRPCPPLGRDPVVALVLELPAMPPIALFGVQFTFCLVAYALIACWYVVPRLFGLPRAVALIPLLWIHVFRVAGATILAPGAIDTGIPEAFRTMVGLGDLATAVLALAAIVLLRRRAPVAIAAVWLCLIIGTADTVNAIIQSVRYDVFTFPLGVNWVIVTMYVPALVVSSVLILATLLGWGGSRAGVHVQERDDRLGRVE